MEFKNETMAKSKRRERFLLLSGKTYLLNIVSSQKCFGISLTDKYGLSYGSLHAASVVVMPGVICYLLKDEKQTEIFTT